MGRCRRYVIAIVAASTSAYADPAESLTVQAQTPRTAELCALCGSVVASHPTFGYAIDVARLHGVTIALGSDYEATGFNTVPAVAPRILAGTAIAGMNVSAQLAYGVGLADDERYGDAQLAAFRPFAHGIAAGASSRLRLDLQHQDAEPVGERAWQLDAGPAASAAWGPVTVGALVGVSAWRWHQVPGDRVGALAEVGIVSTF